MSLNRFSTKSTIPQMSYIDLGYETVKLHIKLLPQPEELQKYNTMLHLDLKQGLLICLSRHTKERI